MKLYTRADSGRFCAGADRRLCDFNDIQASLLRVSAYLLISGGYVHFGGQIDGTVMNDGDFRDIPNL